MAWWKMKNWRTLDKRSYLYKGISLRLGRDIVRPVEKIKASVRANESTWVIDKYAT